MSYKALILTFWMERVKYASKRRSLDLRLTSVAQKRLCLSSLKKTHQQQFLERRNCKNWALPWIYLNLTKLHCNWHPQRISSFESFGLHTMFRFTANTPTFPDFHFLSESTHTSLRRRRYRQPTQAISIRYLSQLTYYCLFNLTAWLSLKRINRCYIGPWASDISAYVINKKIVGAFSAYHLQKKPEVFRKPVRRWPSIKSGTWNIPEHYGTS